MCCQPLRLFLGCLLEPKHVLKLVKCDLQHFQELQRDALASHHKLLIPHGVLPPADQTSPMYLLVPPVKSTDKRTSVRQLQLQYPVEQISTNRSCLHQGQLCWSTPSPDVAMSAVLYAADPDNPAALGGYWLTDKRQPDPVLLAEG